MRRYMKLNEYAKEHIIDAIHNLKVRFYWGNHLFNDVRCELYMNIDTYVTLKSIAKMTNYDLWHSLLWKVDGLATIFDLEIKIDNKMEYLTFMIKESEKMIDSSFIGGKKAGKTYATYINTSTTNIPIWKEVDVIGDKGSECVIPICNTITTRISEEIDNMFLGKNRNRLPKEYYINEKKKTVVLKWNDDTITKVKVSENDKFDARYGFLIAYFQKNCGMSKTKANKYLDNLEKEVK